jgi:D-alanyl-D-alanine carboxypeptidase
MMNAKVAELGLEHTSFANPHGLDAPNHYSSARDLVAITSEAMAFPLFAETVRSRSYVFPPAPDGAPLGSPVIYHGRGQQSHKIR